MCNLEVQCEISYVRVKREKQFRLLLKSTLIKSPLLNYFLNGEFLMNKLNIFCQIRRNELNVFDLNVKIEYNLKYYKVTKIS